VNVNPLGNVAKVAASALAIGILLLLVGCAVPWSSHDGTGQPYISYQHEHVQSTQAQQVPLPVLDSETTVAEYHDNNGQPYISYEYENWPCSRADNSSRDFSRCKAEADRQLAVAQQGGWVPIVCQDSGSTCWSNPHVVLGAAVCPANIDVGTCFANLERTAIQQQATSGPSAQQPQPAQQQEPALQQQEAAQRPPLSEPGGPPAEFAGYDAELHAICDKDMEEMYSYEIENHDPNGEWRRSIWRGWRYFPDRWQSCRSLEQDLCKDPSNEGQEYLDYYAQLKHPTHEQTQLAAQSKTLVEGKLADCENVKQLDSLMQRFEAASSAAERDNDETIRALLSSPGPDSAVPTHTDCKPSWGGGVTCDSY